MTVRMMKLRSIGHTRAGNFGGAGKPTGDDFLDPARLGNALRPGKDSLRMWSLDCVTCGHSHNMKMPFANKKLLR